MGWRWNQSNYVPQDPLTRNHAGNAIGYFHYYCYLSTGGYGGGLSTGSATLTNVTLALNRAGKSGCYPAQKGQGNQIDGDADVRLTNTLILGSGNSCSNPLASGGHNLDSGHTCGCTATGDRTNTDPLLDQALKSNGGFTQTLALLPGSPAIDAGDNAACPATDQRGVARPQGAACDIGAYEVQP